MHGIQTIHGINARNAEAEAILNRYAKQDGRAPTNGAFADRYAKTDRVGHSSVQPWSAGTLFPGTITTFGDGTHQAQFRGIKSERFPTYSHAANWILSRKAEFGKGAAAA